MEEGPWFQGRAGLFFKPWFPEFNPASMSITSTPVHVRLKSPLLVVGRGDLARKENSVGKFIKIDPSQEYKGLLWIFQLHSVTGL
jgi:hypothetical protein